MGWANTVTHWMTAFTSKVELAKLTGATFNEMTNQAEEEMADKIVVALDNLANAVVKKDGTIKILVKATLALTKAVADRDTSILTLTTAITNFSNQRSKGGSSGGGGGSGGSPTADQSAFSPIGLLLVPWLQMQAWPQQRHMQQEEAWAPGHCQERRHARRRHLEPRLKALTVQASRCWGYCSQR